jgi:NADH-quinone oxidoreductase subunit H
MSPVLSNLVTALARFLIFPGLLFAVPAAWFFLWVERKAVARMQERVGPPFMQPFWDFVKLLGKGTPPRPGIAGFIMRAWPLIAVGSAAGAVGLLPVLPASGGFEGDLILLLALLELPSICIIAAGFSSRSIFGEIGSAREAALSVSYNIVFLLAIVSIAASQHTFRLEDLAMLPSSPMRWLGVLAILICLPAKLHINPFSLPNAEQEIYSGPMTEYAGPELAMWELAHGLEWVAATGLVAALVAPNIVALHLAISSWMVAWLAGGIFVALSVVVVLLLSVLAAATARLAIDSSVRFYWQCTLIFAVLAISSALLMRFRS